MIRLIVIAILVGMNIALVVAMSDMEKTTMQTLRLHYFVLSKSEWNCTTKDVQHAEGEPDRCVQITMEGFE